MAPTLNIRDQQQFSRYKSCMLNNYVKITIYGFTFNIVVLWVCVCCFVFICYFVFIYMWCFCVGILLWVFFVCFFIVFVVVLFVFFCFVRGRVLCIFCLLLFLLGVFFCLLLLFCVVCFVVFVCFLFLTNFTMAKYLLSELLAFHWVSIISRTLKPLGYSSANRLIAYIACSKRDVMYTPSFTMVTSKNIHYNSVLV